MGEAKNSFICLIKSPKKEKKEKKGREKEMGLKPFESIKDKLRTIQFSPVYGAVTLKNYPSLRRRLPFFAYMGVTLYVLTYLMEPVAQHRSSRKNVMSYEAAIKKYGPEFQQLLEGDGDEEPEPIKNMTEKEWMEQELNKVDIDSWENKRLPRPWEPETMANAKPPTGTGTLAQQLERKSAAK